MPRRTSQLQVRITEAEKATLRRLAADAGMTISAYVLARALPEASPERARDAQPSAQRAPELERLLRALPPSGSGQREALSEIVRHLETLSLEAAGSDLRLSAGMLDGLPPPLANEIAATAEQIAHDRGVPAPAWAAAVAPLARPSFRWSLPSLRAHQMRVTPVAFKRRNIFFDPATRGDLRRPRRAPVRDGASLGAAAGAPDSSASVGPVLPRLLALEQELKLLELEAEFYITGPAVLLQAFRTNPGTARASAQVASSSTVTEAADRVAGREGWPADWLPTALREALAAGPPFVELDRLRAFAPVPEYVLAVSLLGLAQDTNPSRLDDLRRVLDGLGITGADAALEVAHHYLSPRDLPPDVHGALRALLPES
jgi:hypothetical protein